MHIIFHRDESERQKNSMQQMAPEEGRPLYQTMIYFGLMVAVLVFANWAKPETHEGLWFSIWSFKWYLTSFAGVLLLPVLIYWLGFSGKRLSITALVTVISALFYPTEPAIPFTLAFVGLSISAARDEKSQNREWFEQSWSFARQILPLLFFGVLAAGFLLGRVGNVGIIPSEWIYQAVGGNSISANFFASIAGAFMYFATLTEIPILQGLISNGMGQGPALALLLAGPALSLPNMLVIRSVMGTRKTITYVVLVIIMSTITGIIFGAVA
jgi:hypothetical protein